MDKVLNFLKEVLMLNKDKDNEIKVGLSQFKSRVEEPAPKDISIRSKDVKLSDLMRRVG